MFPGTPSDAQCGIAVGGGYIPFPGETLQPAPWPLSFTHTFAYGPGRMPTGRDIKISRTRAWRDHATHRIPVSVTNIPPVFTAAYTCGVMPILTPIGPILCIGGDFRDVAAGAPLSIRGKIADAPGSAALHQSGLGRQH